VESNVADILDNDKMATLKNNIFRLALCDMDSSLGEIHNR
jgi:hypothetical protein